MYSQVQSLAVHTAMLSHVLVGTVPCGSLCHALICTRRYSPLRSTLPCSHMYSQVQSLAVHSAMLSLVLKRTVSLAVHPAVLSCVLKFHRRQSTYVAHWLRDLQQIQRFVIATSMRNNISLMQYFQNLWCFPSEKVDHNLKCLSTPPLCNESYATLLPSLLLLKCNIEFI